MSEGVEVRASRICGRGLFACRDFKAGEVVLRWDVSHRISAEAADALSEEEKKYTHPYKDGSVILMQPPATFINHSCDNNTEVRDYCDVAIRDIVAGEEITSNYFTDGANQSFACSCGADGCKGKVN